MSFKSLLDLIIKIFFLDFRAGLLPGDIIISVNGIDVKSATDVYKALDQKHSLRFKILRNNIQLDVTIKPQDY